MKRLISNQATTFCTRRRQIVRCIPPTQHQERWFASRKKTPQRAKKNKKKPPKAQSKKLPNGVFMPEPADNNDNDAVVVPPAYLSATASPFCFVATCAVQQANMDPMTLFPPSQQSMYHFHAEYVSPKSLKHELPKWNIPEVAFLGRSNVGKSSLVNALLRNDSLARCSKQPGRTQHVNYFGMYSSSLPKSPAEASGFLVDLPGYGYAKAPQHSIHKWQDTTQSFLLSRRDSNNLKRLFLLVDARRGTFQIDRDIMGWFDEACIPYSVVLTKADRVSRSQVVKFANDVCMRHHSQMYGEEDGSQGPIVHVTSARDGHGIAELMTAIQAEFMEHRHASTQQGDFEGWARDDEMEEYDSDDDIVR